MSMAVSTGISSTQCAGPFTLRDGRSVWLRPLAASDASALMALCGRLSPTTIRRRFMQLVPHCDPAVAMELAAVDQVRRVAIAAVPDPSAADAIVAVGRFHAERDSSDRAEFALLVQDDHQHTGLGRLLLIKLLEAARARGLQVLDGVVLYDNQPMLRLLRSSGQPLEVTWHGGDVLDIRLQVAAQAH
jgi:GNAT superfamily N-acetyltransferase